METRPCSITFVDFHHTAGHEANTEAIRQEHLNIGWGDIGYNVVIESDGTIGWGRDVYYSGSHDPGPAPDGSGYTMNQRSFAISCIGNFDEEFMGEVQFQGLLKGAILANKRFGLSLSQNRKHKDQYATNCPGKNFPWDRLMIELKKELGGGNDVLEVAVLLFTKEDYWSGTDVAAKNGNCAMFVRPADRSVPKDAMSAHELIVVGGPTTGHPNEVLLSGNTKYDTAVAVGKYLG